MILCDIASTLIDRLNAASLNDESMENFIVSQEKN